MALDLVPQPLASPHLSANSAPEASLVPPEALVPPKPAGTTTRTGHQHGQQTQHLLAQKKTKINNSAEL